MESLKLDELVGICDEISALARAGLPLERSLPGGHAYALAEKMAAGTSLADAIAADQGFPPFCASVIRAGLESGNLSGALDTIVALGRRMRDLRLAVLHATLYPLSLFTLLWIVLAGVSCCLLPAVLAFFDDFELAMPTVVLMNWLSAHGAYILPLVLAPPLIGWFCYAIWYWRTSRGTVLARRNSFRLFRFIPWLGTATAEMRKVVFIKNFALLVENAVPLDRALELAREISGENEKNYATLTQWVRGMKGESLADGLKLIAENANLRAERATARCEMFLPAAILFVLAIILTASYFFMIEWPYIYLFHKLAEPGPW